MPPSRIRSLTESCIMTRLETPVMVDHPVEAVRSRVGGIGRHHVFPHIEVTEREVDGRLDFIPPSTVEAESFEQHDENGREFPHLDCFVSLAVTFALGTFPAVVPADLLGFWERGYATFQRGTSVRRKLQLQTVERVEGFWLLPATQTHHSGPGMD